MPVPDFQTVNLPFLKLLADGQEWKMRDVVEALASGFSLTDEEQRQNIFSLVSLPGEGKNLRKIGYDLVRQR